MRYIFADDFRATPAFGTASAAGFALVRLDGQDALLAAPDAVKLRALAEVYLIEVEVVVELHGSLTVRPYFRSSLSSRVKVSPIFTSLARTVEI
jgi:hypothetical protein